MRRSYLVCYDIRHPKRLRRIHRVVKGYGEAWQYSVFFCTLREIDRVRLERDLSDVINGNEDQVLILDLGRDVDGIRESVTSLGIRLPKPESRIIVI